LRGEIGGDFFEMAGQWLEGQRRLQQEIERHEEAQSYM
jgi:hypothetical protein